MQDNLYKEVDIRANKIKELKKDKLVCRIYETRKAMGEAAANDVCDKINELLSEKAEINI